MKQIEPIQYTTDGPVCTHIKVWSRNDDLNERADFEWILFNSIGQIVTKGMIPCEGNNYTVWAGDNNFPYTYVADILGLEIIT